ncbi:MAG: VWA domain-containing protein [Polyangiaceae bacterium]
MRATRIWGRLLRASAVVTALAWAASCGGSEEDNLVTPCEGELKGVCGNTCQQTQECGSGLYCSNDKTCTADCTAGGGQCKGGKFCDSTGRCVSGISVNNDGGNADGCIKADVTFEKTTPTVVLLIDQSGSMTENFGGNNRWNTVRDALMNASTGIVKTLENEVRFGLALYTSHDGNAGGACPVLTEVNISLGNYAAIKAVYDQAQPEDETPTGESIDEVVKKLVPFSEPGPKVIVLATDGEPDTCAQPNPQNGQPESIAAAQNAYKQGIETYVISVGSGVSLNHLQDMANAGKGLAVGGSQNATYYQANDQPALVKAFNEIIYGVRSCVFKLDGKVEASEAGQGSVQLDGKALTYNDPDGWKLNPPSEVEFVGAACQAIKSGDHKVAIDFPCGVYTPPVQ